MKKRENKNIGAIVAVLAVFIGLGIYGLTSRTTAMPSQNLSAIESYAEKIVATCTGEKYHPSCYDKEIPKLMDVISMEDAFKVTRAVQNMDSSYPYCHVLGHELSAREVDKDPSKWKDVVSRCPSGMCSNGCIHGGFQERFRAESFTDAQIKEIKPDLINLCEKRENWNPTGLEQASCYHALGHLAMYLTNADIDKSVNLCEEMALKKDGRDFRSTCFDGVFMQIYQPLEPEDFALVAGKQPTKEEIPQFCSKYTGNRKTSCFSESWPLFNQDIKTASGLQKFCGMNDADYIDHCYTAMFYVLTAQFNFDSEKVTDFCMQLSSERVGQCFANAAGRFMETDYRNIDKSVALCKSSEKFDKDSECFKELVFFSTFNFLPGSEPFFKLCNALPAPWKEQCLQKH